ncbi:MAG: AraC family transcriptional regulator [Clostridia bacterium]|nr:AraC family transcriptional regulator [Clostridia bacterium]MBQ4574447.1 AraC family transcriptional regulator [Clostridia bacterium]
MLKQIGVKDEFNIKIAAAFGMADTIDEVYSKDRIRDEYVIHFIISGSGYFNGVKLHQNQGFIVRPFIENEYHYDSEDPWTYIWIILRGAEASGILAKYGLSGDMETFDYEFQNNFYEAYRALIAGDDSYASYDFLMGLMHMMLSFVRIDETKPKFNRGETLAIEAVRYIDQNYCRGINISDIAAHFFVSHGYLSNIFSKYIGVSPKEYLTTVRAQRSRDLLTETEYPISKISKLVGYDDSMQFSKFFKNRVGMSPTEYRELRKKEQNKNQEDA